VRRLDKLLKFMAFGDSLAELSTCKRAKCGAIVFDWQFEFVAGIGYNGPPHMLPNDSCTGVENKCGCVHAEANALLKAKAKTQRGLGYAMYSTTLPCVHCGGLIINSRTIGVLFWQTSYSDMSSLARLEQAKIIVVDCKDLDKVKWALGAIT
jgi:deoxycytidylate deaminase